MDGVRAQGDIKPTATRSSNREHVAGGRTRLPQEAGLSSAANQHYHRPVERPFTREERDQVTVLFGGLTLRHDQLIYAGLEGLGYRVDRIPVPTKADFQTGKEYGNNGQCNPTYFTVGALINYLQRLREEKGIPTERILSDYVFATGGACGACRFGMYETEYRMALRNAGFDGFRVLLFEQKGGLSQTGGEAGLEMNVPFFLTLINAIFMGDVLNAIANHIRPYEIEPGKTNQVFDKCLSVCQRVLRSKDYDAVQDSIVAKLLSKAIQVDCHETAVFLDQLGAGIYLQALEECRRIINSEIEVDYTRAKPIVKVTGEFWAQTTEGDGNFNMFRFLESEGAEVLVEPVATWLDYIINFYRQYISDRHGISEGSEPLRFWNMGKRFQREGAYRKKMFALALTQRLFTREFERLRTALGGTAHRLSNQLELQRVAHPYYNSRIDGGEGHLEVAKNIYYCNHDLAHMVLSLKPFGCLPSTQSDGAQAAVVANYPDMIFLPIETSGEGDINAHSRVQMALGEAKSKCKGEFRSTIARSDYSLEDIRAYVADHRELRRPLQRVPGRKGVVGRAANFVLHVASLMDQDPAWAARKSAVQATTD